MRWYFEKEDGHFWMAEFDQEGGVVFSEGPAGGDVETTLEEDFGDIGSAVEAVRARAREMNAKGYGPATHPDERYQPEPRAYQYFTEEFVAELGIGERESRGLRARLEEYQATTFPAELSRFLDIVDTHTFGYTNFGEWRMWDDDFWAPAPEDGNLFEQLVVLDQQNYLGTAMIEYLAGCVFIGTLGNGDAYFAHPSLNDKNHAEVMFWNHETANMESPIADSISTLAWLNHLYTFLESDDFDADAFSAGMARIEDRANLSWHYNSLEEQAEIYPEYKEKGNARYYFFRSAWISYLLRQNGVVEVEDVGDLFYQDYHAPQHFADALAGPYLTSSPVTGLYWLWRLWWFAKPELKQCLEVCKEASSPIVRDCAALIEEFEGGRKELGKISDIHKLRERFIALDLDPERADERLAEQERAEAEAEMRLAALLEDAHEVVASCTPEQTLERAWDFVGEPDVLEVLYEHAVGGLPKLAAVDARWRFRVDGGASRDNSIFRFEEEQTAEALGATGQAFVPWMLSLNGHDWLEIAARTGDERVAPFVLRTLEVREKYNHKLRSAVKAVGQLGLVDAGPKLAAMLEEFRYDPDDYMTEISNGDLMVTLIDTCAALGVTEALPVVQELAEASRDKLRPRAIKALGKLGGAEATSLLAPYLETAWVRPTLFALAELGTPEARDAIDAKIGSVLGAAPKLAFERVMLEAARLACGDEVDWSAVEYAAGLVESHKFEDLELKTTLVRMLPSHPDKAWAQEQARLFLDYELEGVRVAAIEAQRAMGLVPELVYLDRGYVDWLYASKGVDAMKTALKDPFAIFKENVLRAAVDGGWTAEIEAEAIAYVEECARFTVYTNGFVRFEHNRVEYALKALIAFESEAADKVLFRLAKGSCALYSTCDVFKYDRGGIKARLEALEAAGYAIDRRADESTGTFEVEPLVPTPWLYGGSINGLAWNPDGSLLAVAGSVGVKIFDTTGALVADAASMRGGWIYDVRWSPDGEILAAGAHAGHLHLMDQSGGLIRRLEGHRGVPNGVRKLRFSPDGAKLASVSDDESLRIWDVASGEELGVHADPADVNGVDWIDGERVVIATDRMVKVVTVTDMKVQVEVSTGSVADVRVGPDGRIFAGAAGIRVFDARLEEDESATMLQSNVARLSFFDGKVIAASWEGEDSVCAWEVSGEAPIRRHWPGAEGQLFGADVHPKTGEFMTGGQNGTLYRFAPSGTLIENDAVFHTGEVEAVILDDALWTVSGKECIAWDLQSLRPLEVYRSHGPRFTCAVATESHVFISTGGGVVAFARGESEPAWEVESGRSECVFVSGDAVVAANYNALTWYDTATGEVLFSTEPFTASFMFWYARIDADRVAVAGYDDRRLFVWNLTSRELEGEMPLPAGEKNSIRAVGVSGGKALVSRWDGAIDIFDTTTLEHLAQARLEGAHAPVELSPSGREAALGWGSEVRVVNADSFDQKASFALTSSIERIVWLDDDTLVCGLKSGALEIARRT